MNTNRVTILSVLFLLLAAMLRGNESALTVTQYSHGENLRIRCRYSRDLPILYRISTICSAEVRKWLREYNRRPKTEMELLFSEDADRKSFNPLSRRIRLHPGSSPEKLYHRLLSAFIGRHILENCGGGDRNLECLSWIAAGLYHRIYYDGKGFSLRYTPDFRIAREQFDNGFYPDPELLLRHPVPAERTELYRLYSLYCDVFLKALENQDPKNQTFLRQFLEFQSYNRPQIDSLQFLIQGRTGGSADLASWFREQMYTASGEGIRKAQAEEIARQLRDIVTMPVIAKDRPGEITDLPLYKLPSKMLTRKFLSRREIALARLHLRAPLLLQTPIFEYIQALQCRTSLRRTQEYKKAAADFAAAYRRQCCAEEMMDRHEKTAAGKMGAFVNDWKIIERYQKLRHELFSTALREPAPLDDQSTR